jgi:hypothetical protein
MAGKIRICSDQKGVNSAIMLTDTDTNNKRTLVASLCDTLRGVNSSLNPERKYSFIETLIEDV